MDLLSDIGVDSVDEMTVSDLEVVCEEYETDLNSLLFSHNFKTNDKLLKNTSDVLLFLKWNRVSRDKKVVKRWNKYLLAVCSAIAK